MTAAAEKPAMRVYLKDYAPPPYFVRRAELAFNLRAARTRVKAKLYIEPNASVRNRGPLRLDGEALTLLSVAIDGRFLAAAEYQRDDETLTLDVPQQPFTVEIENEIEPEKNTALEGLFLSGKTLATQCEAEGFRRITYFVDRPDNLAIFSVRLEADAACFPALLSNGNKIASGALPDGRHWVEWHDPFPKPCYLFALVAGDLARVEDGFVTRSGRAVALHLYVEHGNEKRALYALEALKRAMAWDEETFGLEYDLDLFQIVAVADFNMGAMENKGLNIFNAKYILADPDTATDQDYAAIEAVVAHEYFHNWTGDRVTCRDWFQLSLKEGLTVFRDQQFSADMRSAPVERIADVRTLRAVQFAEDEGPLAHPVRPESYIEINNFYTSTVYEKGAEVIRMIHTLIGADSFRHGLRLYIERNDGKAATVEDFVAAMEEASGRDLGQFRLWYSQAGTPEISVSQHYDARAQSYELQLSQRTPPTPGQEKKSPLHIPIAVGLLGKNGEDLPLQLEGETKPISGTRILELKEAQASFRFKAVPSKPVLSLMRGFSAPVKIVAGIDDADRAQLTAYDSDPFNRWEAGQQFATGLILDHIKSTKTDDRAEILIEGLARTLHDGALDHAFVALALTLPSERDLGRAMDVVDVEGIHHARAFFERYIATRLKDRFFDLYARLAINAPYAPTAKQAGARALRNAALRYLAKTGEPEMIALAQRHYDNASNMTDAIAGLSILADLEDRARGPAIDSFYRRWRDNPLVVDKWLSIQALAAVPETLDTVRGLMAHEAFSLRNPNKVRSLIGAFAQGNQLRFHAADGAGYRLVADVVLTLDSSNPQVASRLVTAFEGFRRFDKTRQNMMRAELSRIAAAKPLSRNLYEMTQRLLA